MRRSTRSRGLWIAAVVMLALVTGSLLVHRPASSSPGPGEVRVTGTILNRIPGSRTCDAKTARVGFHLNGEDHQGSTRVFPCSGSNEGDHIEVIVRTRDYKVMGSPAKPWPFAAEVGIATFLVLGIAVCAAWAVRRHLVNRLIRATTLGSNKDT